MRKGKILKGAVVLLLALAMVFSSGAVANTRVKQTEITLNTTHEGTSAGTIGAVVWDNGMDYQGLMSTQWDAGIQFDSYLADDFHFEEDTEVQDVHWVGGYWGDNYQNGDFDWCISFMYDDGTGGAPDSHPQTPSFAGPFCFDWDGIMKELLDDSGTSIYYELSVLLPEPIMFPGCEKIWIAIWAEGAYPPQSGWGYHDYFQLSPAVWGSAYFEYEFWTPGYEVQGFDFDMAFQLTGACEGVGKICCDPGQLDWVDVPPGGTVTGSFYVWNCGEECSILNWKVDSWPTTWGTWTFNPPAGVLNEGDGITVDVTVIAPPDVNTPFSGTIKVINVDDPSNFCEMQTSLETPRSRSVNTLFLRFLEQFPNTFPMLRYILGL